MISTQTRHIYTGLIAGLYVRAMLGLLSIALLIPLIKKPLLRFRAKVRGLEIQIREEVKALQILSSCECINDKTQSIKSGDIIAFIRKVPAKPLFDDFFPYYRELGVNHFILLGCYPDLPDLAYLKNDPDVSLWVSSEKQPTWMNKNGIHALNGLLARYGRNHWCFIIDSDEYFVYPKMDTRSLRELVAYLDQERKTGFIALTIDMFGKGSIGGDTVTHRGSRSRHDYRWFDTDGLVQWWDTARKAWLIVGGGRRRLLFAKNPKTSPLINRVPLVKWQSRFMLAPQAVTLRPLKLNNPGFGNRITPTGCLLQYRFCNASKVSLLMEILGRLHSQQHTRHASDACNNLSLKEVMWHEEAAEYRGEWRQFVQLGLMNIGTWF